jgi:hypothetical protein
MPENELINAESGKAKTLSSALCFNSLLTESCDELRPTWADFNDVALYKIYRMCVLQRCFRAAHCTKKEIFKRKGTSSTCILAFEAMAITAVNAVTFAVVRKPGHVCLKAKMCSIDLLWGKTLFQPRHCGTSGYGERTP